MPRPSTAVRLVAGRRQRRRALAWLVLACLGAAAGCGGDTKQPETTPPAPADVRTVTRPRDALVSAADIRRAGRHSPERTLLIWWQGLQFGDVDSVGGQYADRPRNLAQKLREIGPSLNVTLPLVHERTVDGDRARLLVILKTHQFSEGQVSATEAPVTLRLVRRDRRWKLADDRYLNSRLQAQREAERSR